MNLTHEEKQIIKYVRACGELPHNLVPNVEFIRLIERLADGIENIDGTCSDCKHFEYRYAETGTGYGRGKCTMLSYNDAEYVYSKRLYAKCGDKIESAEIMVASNFICGLFRKKPES